MTKEAGRMKREVYARTVHSWLVVVAEEVLCRQRPDLREEVVVEDRWFHHGLVAAVGEHHHDHRSLQAGVELGYRNHRDG